MPNSSRGRSSGPISTSSVGVPPQQPASIRQPTKARSRPASREVRAARGLGRPEFGSSEGPSPPVRLSAPARSERAATGWTVRSVDRKGRYRIVSWWGGPGAGSGTRFGIYERGPPSKSQTRSFAGWHNLRAQARDSWPANPVAGKGLPGRSEQVTPPVGGALLTLSAQDPIRLGPEPAKTRSCRAPFGRDPCGPGPGRF